MTVATNIITPITIQNIIDENICSTSKKTTKDMIPLTLESSFKPNVPNKNRITDGAKLAMCINKLSIHKTLVSV